MKTCPLKCRVLLYIYVYIRNIRTIWFCCTSPKIAAYFEISFNSFYGKKVQAIIHVAVPFDGTCGGKSDMGQSKAKPKRK